MEFIVLSALCSISIAHLLKLTLKLNLRLSHVLMVNYFVATITAAAQVNPSLNSIGTPDMWAVGLITGIIFIGTFFLYGYCVNINGVGLSLAAMRMSLAIPIFVSVIFFKEELGIKAIAGLILVFVALLMMIPKVEKDEVRKKTKKIGAYHSGLVLFMLFLLAGLGDSSLKLYERYYLEIAREELFMAFVFTGAFVMSLVISIQSGQFAPKPVEMLLGVVVGLPNLYSSIFVIKALTMMDASRVFSMVNLIIVVLGALTGWLFWKDRIQPRQLAGLVIALVASFLLAYV